MTKYIEETKRRIGVALSAKSLTIHVQISDDDMLSMLYRTGVKRFIPGKWRIGRTFYFWTNGAYAQYAKGGWWDISAPNEVAMRKVCSYILEMLHAAPIAEMKAGSQLPLEQPPASKETALKYIAKCREILAKPKG